MKKIKPRFKVGDWLYYNGTQDGYLHVVRIEIVNGVVYYLHIHSLVARMIQIIHLNLLMISMISLSFIRSILN